MRELLCVCSALLLVDCLVPDVEIVDSLSGSAEGGASGGTGLSVAKFCSVVTLNDASTKLRLDIGEGSSQVTLRTPTDSCSPVVNDDCTPVPTGKAVPVALVNESSGNTLFSAAVAIDPGQAWIFFADVSDAATATPILDADNTHTPSECKTGDYADFL